MNDVMKASDGGAEAHHGTALLVAGIMDMGAAMFGVSEALHATYPPVGSALHRLAGYAHAHAHWMHRTEPTAPGEAERPTAPPANPGTSDPGQLTHAEWATHHEEACRRAEAFLEDLSRHPEAAADPGVAAEAGNLAAKLSDAKAGLAGTGRKP